MKKFNNRYLTILLVLSVWRIVLPSHTYGQDTQRAAGGREPIDVNLIIDGSSAFNDVRDEISVWISTRLDQILTDGDKVTIWSAGPSARVIYSGTVTGTSERDTVKKTVRELSVSGNSADFSGALRDAAGRQSSGFSYTLLISASPQSITGVHANQLRYSRVEEFSSWRALVVGLNFDTKVKRAANSFFGS